MGQTKGKSKMIVDLIDFTGKCSSDPWYAAKLLVYTKNTRLEQGPDTYNKIFSMGEDELYRELNYISNTIRSSWEMVDFTFSIRQVTRAFTHQLVRTRTASYAQQAMRIADMGNFETLVPESVKKFDGGSDWSDCMNKISNVYKFYQENGIPTQDCRGVLPTNVLTNIIMKVNLRTLADLVGKRDNLRAQGEYTDVVIEMERLAIDVWPWVRPFLKPDRTATPALEAILKKALGDRAPSSVPEINDALKELDRLKGIWG